MKHGTESLTPYRLMPDEVLARAVAELAHDLEQLRYRSPVPELERAALADALAEARAEQERRRV